MAKFKVSYKMLKEQTGVVAEISKQLMTIADELDGVASQLQGETATQSIARVLMDAAATMNGYTDGLNNMGKTMQQIIDKYTKTENNNSKRVDSARAHNRDFYKNAVSVPSASVGSGGGGGSATANASVTVNMGGAAAPAAAATTAATAAPASGASSAFQGGGTVAPGGAAAVTASAARVSTTSRVVPAGVAGGTNTAAVAGAAAAGAAVAGAAVAAGISKKKKGKAVEATAAPTPRDAGLEDAERRLEEAIASANQLK